LAEQQKWQGRGLGGATTVAAAFGGSFNRSRLLRGRDGQREESWMFSGSSLNTSTMDK